MSTTTGNKDDKRSDSTLTPLKELDQNIKVRPVYPKLKAKVLQEIMDDRNGEELRPCSVKFQDEEPDLGYEVPGEKFIANYESMETNIQNLKQEHESSEEQYKKRIQNLKQERESSEEQYKRRIQNLKKERESSEEQYKRRIQNLKQERESSDEHFKKGIEDLDKELQQVREEFLPFLNLIPQQTEALGSQLAEEEDLVDTQEPATTTSQVTTVDEPTADEDLIDTQEPATTTSQVAPVDVVAAASQTTSCSPSQEPADDTKDDGGCRCIVM